MTTQLTYQGLYRLPKGYHWQIRLLQRLNSIHLSLIRDYRGPSGLWQVIVNFKDWHHELTSTCAVLNAFHKPLEQIVQEIMNASNELGRKYFGAPQDEAPWLEKAAALSAALYAADPLGPEPEVTVEME